MMDTGMVMNMNRENSFNISKRNIDQISSSTAAGIGIGNNQFKTRRLDVSLPSQRRNSMISSLSTSTPTGMSTSPFVAPSFITNSFMSSLPRRSTFPGGTTTTAGARSSISIGVNTISLPVLSPCTYMVMSLKNKKIKARYDPFSIEQAMYFEPYTESEIKLDLLKALRASNLDQLRSFHERSSNKIKNKQNDKDDDEDAKKEKQEQEQEQDKEKENPPSPSPRSSSTEASLKAKNQFGENLVHIASRMGISHEILKFLIDDAEIPLNVRDKFGRTPLHNACMSSLPNFDNIHFILMQAPKLLLFEDEKGKIPFELIPQRCYERWTRFLSEKNILKRISTELANMSM